MNFDTSGGGQAGKGAVDPELARFIQAESQRQRFQAMVHNMADACWDLCMAEKPPAKIDGKTDTCINNCVNRLIDASNFILQRLQETRFKQQGGDSPGFE